MRFQEIFQNPMISSCYQSRGVRGVLRASKSHGVANPLKSLDIIFQAKIKKSNDFKGLVDLGFLKALSRVRLRSAMLRTLRIVFLRGPLKSLEKSFFCFSGFKKSCVYSALFLTSSYHWGSYRLTFLRIRHILRL